MCAKRASKDLNYALGGAPLESYITSISQDVTVELPVVTALGDTGPRRVEGNYDFSYSLEGPNDFAAGAVDAALFGRIGNGSASSGFDPTGGVVGASDPHYDSTVFLESYSIRVSVGAAQTYSASLQGTAALTRAVA